MTQIKNNINTYATPTAYNNDFNKDFPNVSYIQATDEVKWYKYDPEYVVAKYNVTSTSSATQLLGSSSGVSKQYIDGVEQESVQLTYTFDTTGEHIVKYELSGTSIATNTFQNCTSLTIVTIPSSVTTIGNRAFENCGSLKINKYSVGNVLNLPNSVTTIENHAFNQTNYNGIVLGENITSIGLSSFATKTNYILQSCTIRTVVPPTMNSSFMNVANNFIIYVPSESVETYKAASGWSTYASRIQAIPNS